VQQGGLFSALVGALSGEVDSTCVGKEVRWHQVGSLVKLCSKPAFLSQIEGHRRPNKRQALLRVLWALVGGGGGPSPRAWPPAQIQRIAAALERFAGQYDERRRALERQQRHAVEKGHSGAYSTASLKEMLLPGLRPWCALFHPNALEHPKEEFELASRDADDAALADFDWEEPLLSRIPLLDDAAEPLTLLSPQPTPAPLSPPTELVAERASHWRTHRALKVEEEKGVAAATAARAAAKVAKQLASLQAKGLKVGALQEQLRLAAKEAPISLCPPPTPHQPTTP